MAVKALAVIYDCTFDADAHEITVWLNIEAVGGRHYNVPMDPLPDSSVGSYVNQQARTFVKAYAEEWLGAEFGLLDTVRLLFGVDLA